MVLFGSLHLDLRSSCSRREIFPFIFWTNGLLLLCGSHQFLDLFFLLFGCRFLHGFVDLPHVTCKGNQLLLVCIWAGPGAIVLEIGVLAMGHLHQLCLHVFHIAIINLVMVTFYPGNKCLIGGSFISLKKVCDGCCIFHCTCTQFTVLVFNVDMKASISESSLIITMGRFSWSLRMHLLAALVSTWVQAIIMRKSTHSPCISLHRT